MTRETYTLADLVSWLAEAGHVAPEGAAEILRRAPEQRARYLQQRFGGDRRAGARYKLDAGELVTFLELRAADGRALDQHRIAEVLARAAGLPYLRIDPLAIDMEFAVRSLPKAFAIRHAVLPVRAEAGGLLVAVADPFDGEALASLERRLKGSVRRVVAGKDDILKYLTEIFGFRLSVESAAQEADGEPLLGDFEQLVRLRTAGEIDANDRHVVNAVDQLLAHAYDQRASDIHVEPRREDSQVRLRIDGVLHRFYRFPRKIHPAIVSRIKSMSRLDITERRRPQDGRIKTVRHDKTVELRVSTMPVAFGEKVVIRIFDPGVLTVDLAHLGFDATERATFDGWIRQPHGLVLVTGPTGSGKSTTLYTALRSLAGDRLNIVSVEDPIEMVTDQFNQVSVQPRAGIDFASALRHILRQDPDVIMVGEIRDTATAEMAAQAALTGHLVLSTLHTNDAAGAITRLRDQGLPPYLIASTLLGVMAQRLVRRVCADCSEPAAVDPATALLLGLAVERLPALAGAARGRGCQFCRHTGYRGRAGIFEMLSASGEVSALLQRGETDEAGLRAAAVRAGMTSLRQAAMRRLADGSTSVEEVLRVCGRAHGAEPFSFPPPEEAAAPPSRSRPVAVPPVQPAPLPAPPQAASEAEGELPLDITLGTLGSLSGETEPEPRRDAGGVDAGAARVERSFAAAAQHLEVRILSVISSDPPASGKELLQRYSRGERDFRGAELAGVDLAGASLPRVDLSEADLSDSRLNDADLSRARLRQVDLTRADLRAADLAGADLSWSQFGKARLERARLQHADLRGARLAGANLRWADLRGAILTGADLHGAALSGCRSDLATAWPADVEPPPEDRSDSRSTARARSGPDGSPASERTGPAPGPRRPRKRP